MYTGLRPVQANSVMVFLRVSSIASSLYRGIISPLAGVAFINAICFGVYGNVNRRLENSNSIQSITIAGSVSGFVQAFLCSPMELIKTQMQIGDGHLGVKDTIKNIISHSGWRGLTKGLGITITREVPAFGIYFSSYEYMVSGRQDNAPLVFAAGGMSGVFSWIFTYPIDVIKSRLQADIDGRFKSPIHCLVTSLKEEGHKFLFRGVSSTVIRAFPTNAATMGVVTLIMKTFGEEETSVYDTMARMRMAESLHVRLPKNFDSPRYKFHSNVSTLCIEGPVIVQIQKPIFYVAPYRLFVETMLAAMPSDGDKKDLEVGTIRSGVKLGKISRIVTKILKSNKVNRNHYDEEFQVMVDLNAVSQDVIHSCFRSKVILEEQQREKDLLERLEKEYEESQETIKTPSILLSNNGSRIVQESHVTTSDFLNNTSSLISTSKTNRIYGFYYLM
ncbi:uncharacterized protein [Lepeophtheirus salmonis]|uniref:uncharacterized protein isoform X2 n=1 Tax=Lepeophtheirus salmonis TaxID=72036 RepID=UPI003AF35B1D